MKKYDVLIVGGGPAGSTLAYCLLNSAPEKARLKIAVLDKKSFPRPKVCAGWVTPDVMRLLNIDLDDYAKGRVLQKIRGFKISLLGQRQVESHYPGSPVSYGIRRFEFDDYLLKRCRAELILDEAFKKMERVDNGKQAGWIVNDKYQAGLVIGAGGHYCPVARAIDSKGVSELAVVAQEAEFEMTPLQKQNCRIKEEVPELFFLPDLMGYGWVFRKGDYLNIGLGREDKSKLSSHVTAFCDYLCAQGKIPDDITAKYNGHAYLLYNHAVRDMVADNVLLIGDSAGLAYPQSGEGIRPAVESALLAAETIRVCDADFSRENLQTYVDKIQQRFGERQPCPDLMERLPAFLKKMFARQLMRTKWFTRNVVTDKWFLQSHQAPMRAVNE
ncbi:MAG TPA: NAD(P)/FAD-dependent oxidoreductase [Gammaproteobacteria bacterium]|nr:NAD(P)/FAD-dependent oxidoreductase [Gammaproteobacteria bacterium]